MRKEDDSTKWEGWIETEDLADYSWNAADEEITSSHAYT